MGAALGTKRRVTRRSQDSRTAQLKTAETAIETANKKTNEEFILEYVHPSQESWPSWTHPKSGDEYSISLRSPSDMSSADLEACYDMVNYTSGDDYRRLSVGWHPEAKRKEMRSPGLRYILVKTTAAKAKKQERGNGDDDASGTEKQHVNDGEDGGGGGGGGEIRAFTSLMPTFEDGRPVVYCYEIHLMPELLGAGLGSLLMSHVLAAADSIPTLERTVLTCFACNARARRFYEALGFAVDAESSPRPRRLRGKVVEPEYVIMSRRTTRSGGEADGGGGGGGGGGALVGVESAARQGKRLKTTQGE